MFEITEPRRHFYLKPIKFHQCVNVKVIIPTDTGWYFNLKICNKTASPLPTTAPPSTPSPPPLPIKNKFSLIQKGYALAFTLYLVIIIQLLTRDTAKEKKSQKQSDKNITKSLRNDFLHKSLKAISFVLHQHTVYLFLLMEETG